jgi:hypothetical protein
MPLGYVYVKPFVYGKGNEMEPNERAYPSIASAAANKFDTLPGDMVKMSYMGTQVFSDLVLMNADASIQLEIDTALIEVNCKKRVVKTSITGRDGTVKETINNDDCQLRIRALLINPEADTPPLGAIEMLEQIRKINDNIIVVSPYLNDVFKIYNIIVDDVRYRQNEGELNIIPVDISATEDKELSLIVDEL